LKLLGGLTPQQNPKQSAKDAQDLNDYSAAPQTAERPSATVNPAAESVHNVMADVITRHEQLAARARRTK